MLSQIRVFTFFSPKMSYENIPEKSEEALSSVFISLLLFLNPEKPKLRLEITLRNFYVKLEQ